MKHITIQIKIGISDNDYINPSEINNLISEDIMPWFESNFYDGDSEDRAKLLSIATDYTYT